MKETIVSNSEKAFLADLISKNLRLDGRDSDQFRAIKINFSSEWGCVHVTLGETRVLAKVTCEIAQPKSTRPNEGLLFLKVELGPMAAPHFEANRMSDLGVQVNRILERAFKDSRCIDLESLCIVAEEKVWNLRVDLNVLNHEGNIIDCASIAALAAMAHFKRPDVTISGDEVIIHTAAEKDPIPIVLHHYPVCISYAIFNNGEIALADPSSIEERVAEANLVFGLNSYRELCGLHFGGITLSGSQLFLRCASRAAKHAKFFVNFVKEALKLDEKDRADGKEIGFTECVRLSKITSLAQERLPIKLREFQLNGDEEEEDEVMEEDEKDQSTVIAVDKKSAVLMPDKPKYMRDGDDDEDDSSDGFSDSDDDDDDDDDIEMGPAPPPPPPFIKPKLESEKIAASPKPLLKSQKSKKKKKPKRTLLDDPIMMDDDDDDDDSEEGETIQLENNFLKKK